MIDNIFLETLKEFGANQFEHSTRRLIDHLLGTHHLLQSWNVPTDTSLAGLFHSIYGTKYYKNRTLEYSDREKVRKIIGSQAEHLAYLFCVTDRREFFANIGCTHPVLNDSQVDAECPITHQTLDQLLAIEVANWLEIVPYIHHTISPTSIHRTLELYELAIGSLPSKAIKDLDDLKTQLIPRSGVSTNSD